jgi:phage gp36-like protein
MGYATQADLEVRFGVEEILQLTDRAGVKIVDAAVVTSALDDADNDIDGYVAVVYSLPLETTPPLLTRIACDIARFRLYKDHAGDQVRDAYTDAVDTLTRIAAGKVKLPVPAPAEAPAKTVSAKPLSRIGVFTDTELGKML